MTQRARLRCRRPSPLRSFSLHSLFPAFSLELSGFGFFFVLVGRPGNALMRGAQGRRPARAKIVEIGPPRLDAVVEIGLAVVGAHNHPFDGQAYAEIRA